MSPVGANTDRTQAQRRLLIRIMAVCLFVSTALLAPLLGFSTTWLLVTVRSLGLGGPGVAVLLSNRGWHKTAVVVLLPGMLDVAVHGGVLIWVIVMGASHGLAVACVALFVAVVAGMRRLARRGGPKLYLALPIIGGTILAFPAMGVMAFLNWPATEETCAPLEEQPGVAWVSNDPPMFFGQDMVLIDGSEHLVATFKIYHDLLLDTPAGEGNGVVQYERRDGRWAAAFVERMRGDEMPEYLYFDEDRRRSVFTVLRGDRRHAWGALTLGTSPDDPPRLQFVPTPRGFEPNSITGIDDNYAMISMDGVLIVVDGNTGEELHRWHSPPPFRRDETTPFGPTFVWDAHADEAGHLYLSYGAGKIVETDLRTGSTREAAVPFGGMTVRVSPELDRAIVADVLFHALHVVVRSEMAHLVSRGLSYSPRGVAIDPTTARIYVGEYVGGGLHAYQLPGLEEIGEPVRVGRNVRRLRWDASRRELFAATRCGLLRIDPEIAFPATDRDDG